MNFMRIRERVLRMSVRADILEEYSCHLDGDWCWIWGGHRQNNCYGQVSISKSKRGKRWKVKKMTAHKASYCAFKEISPDSIDKEVCIRHKCATKACCNPGHLESGTYSQNSYDYYRHKRAAA